MSKRELIDIQTPNKDVVASFIYSWARQKDMSILEQRVVLRIIEEECDHHHASLGGTIQHENEAQGHRTGTLQPAWQDV